MTSHKKIKTCDVNFCKKELTKFGNKKFRRNKAWINFLKGLKIKVDIFRWAKNIINHNNINNTNY